MRIAALPLAYLYDPVIFAGSLFHQVAFFDGVGKRFFDIHVFASLAGEDSRQAVPVVGGTDNDSVDILVVDDMAPILIQVRNFFSGLFFYIGGPFVQPFVVDIAEGDTFHFRIFQKLTQVGETHTAASDQSDFHFVACCRLSVN